MCIALTELMLGHGCVHKDIGLVDHPDVSKALGNAGEGPVLGLHVEVAESEGQAHCVEAQQLRSVHYCGKVSAQSCAVVPEAIHKKVVPSSNPVPCESLHAACDISGSWRVTCVAMHDAHDVKVGSMYCRFVPYQLKKGREEAGIHNRVTLSALHRQIIRIC